MIQERYKTMVAYSMSYLRPDPHETARVVISRKGLRAVAKEYNAYRHMLGLRPVKPDTVRRYSYYLDQYGMNRVPSSFNGYLATRAQTLICEMVNDD